ncbi:MAG: hypothetical protein KC925_00015 [Candidatus Doudnabacteria bacterium]|nr:hypothetical protein [Candidatus Doudnabacteria bacterium]MCA9387875.1 hypothetical protein [Candidatus Andersenbacteria bacterium]
MSRLLDHFFSVDLKPQEEVKVLIRRHSLTFVKPVAVAAAVALLPLVAVVPLANVLESGRGWLFAAHALIALGAGLWLLRRFAIWYLDSFVVTNQRVINVEQNALFKRSISEALLSSIEDVRYDVEGVFATMFQYGSVHIRTAATELTMHGVPDPRVIQDLVVRLQRDARRVEQSDTSFGTSLASSIPADIPAHEHIA